MMEGESRGMSGFDSEEVKKNKEKNVYRIQARNPGHRNKSDHYPGELAGCPGKNMGLLCAGGNIPQSLPSEHWFRDAR